MDAATPVSVHLDLRANLLTIRWADGLVSRYGGAYLRWICPCAACTGHVPGEVPPVPFERVKDVRVTHVDPVGTYALKLVLSDGHDSGIYSYDHLRARHPEAGPDRAPPAPPPPSPGA